MDCSNNDYSKILHNDIENMTIKQIKERLDSLTNMCAEMSIKLNEFNTEKAIQEVRKELERLRKKSFTFSDKDWKSVDDFVQKHYGMNNTNHKNQVHSISYIFTPTEVGDCAEVVCTCGEKLTFFY